MRLNNNLAFLCIIAIIISLFGYLSIIEKTENFVPTSWVAAPTGTIGVTVEGNVTFQANLTQPDGIRLNATASFTSATRNVSANATNGNLSVTLYTDTYNISILSLNDYLNFTLVSVPITQSVNDTLRLDNISSSTATLLLPSGYEFTNVYAIETILSYDSVNLTLKYSDPSQVSEANLKPYRCANYDFDTRTCSGTWNVISVYAQDIIANTFSFALTSLSGFAIGAALPEEVVPVVGGRLAREEFGVDKEMIKVKLRQGETKKETLKVTNTGETRLTIKIDIKGEDLRDLVLVEEEKFVLQRGDSKVVLLTFTAAPNQKPDVYVGKTIVKGDGRVIEIPTVIEVVTKGPVFDVIVETPEKFKKVLAGEEVVAKTRIYNLERMGLIDILIEYFIKDTGGNIIASESETVAIETQISTVKGLKVPEDAKPGDYVFYVRVSYEEIIGIGSDTFKVIAPPLIPIIYLKVILSLVVFTIVAIFIIILYNKYKAVEKAIKRYGMITDRQLIKPRPKIKKKR